MNVSRLVIGGLFLGMALLLAGCGGEASAADSGSSAAAVAAAPAAAPAAGAAAPVAEAAPVVAPPAVEAAGGSGANGPRPELPHKAPLFHNADVKRILPSRLVIPAIKVDTPVVELGWKTSKTASGSIFSEWDVADYAAGWHKNSSVPGEAGNVVMSGHNNILGSVFRELDQLKAGDQLEVFAGGTEYTYAVDEVLILPEKHASEQQRKANVKYIQETPDDRLTLVSCWPRDDNTHRIVVIAKPVGATVKATN
jgi:sortase A